MDRAFSSEECNLLAGALQQAWDLFLRSRRLDAGNIDHALGALAAGILEEASKGEHNPRRLAIRSVALIDIHLPKLKLRTN